MTTKPLDPAPALPPPRRSFLYQAAAFVVSAVVGLGPLAAGLAFFADPLLRRRATMKGADADGYLPVAKKAELPADGTPMRFAIVADKIDAWNIVPKQTIGTVYLRLINDQVIAFNDVCPHLGCKIDYKPATGTFFCPCHASAFNLEGEKTNPIPPRGMDTLQVRVDEAGVVWVQYINFQRGTAEKVPV
jgi:menaquinol-cytochrome c reductase iron-sulfur subunit